MTRWARAGNSQKHKKMPGDGTKWGEFDLQETNKSLPEQQKKIERRLNNNHTEKPSCSTDISVKKSTDSYKMCKKLDKRKKNCFSVDVKNEKDNGSGVTVSTTQEEVSSQEKSFLAQKVSVKKLKRKTRNQNVNDKSSEMASNKTFEKKKGMYLEKLKKKRAENGILLLPSKIERKLYCIKRSLREKRVPPTLIKDIIRKERRKEELKFRKTFSQSKLCFNCRQAGHILADCPIKLGSSNQETGICFKCGSMEHTSYQCPENVQGFPFAKCFICKEQGHISKDCPKNKHGVYPKGGRCNLCGNVNHLKKDCPSLSKKKDDQESTITLETMNENTRIDAEVSERSHVKKENVKKPKIVKF